jgi:hypothetical protein
MALITLRLVQVPHFFFSFFLFTNTTLHSPQHLQISIDYNSRIIEELRWVVARE